MKNNYPIKYAVMPIEGQTGWSIGLNELERKYDVICYIASKCYVVGKEEKNDMYGNTTLHYKVVFPYERDIYNIYLTRVEPSYCLMDGRCTNSINVDKVFDNFDEAKEEADKKNKEIVNKKICYLHCDDNFLQNVDLIREEQKEKVNKYRKIERKMERSSSDLVVNAKAKEQTVIFAHNDSFGKHEYSLYYLIKFYYNDANFIAYNISLEDYNRLKEQINDGEKVNISDINRNLLLVNNGSEKKIKVINHNSDDKRCCFYIKDGSLYYDDKIDASLDDISDDTLVVYTIENYDDIINSYIVDAVISEDTPKNKDTEKVLRKRIELR